MIRHANTHLKHRSLDTAVEIKIHTIAKSSIDISSVIPDDMANFGNMLNDTVNLDNVPSGHTNLYLTFNDDTTNEGLGIHDSLCDAHPSTSRAIVNWRESTEKSAVTLAHEIFHNFGVRHDFASPGWRQKCCSKGDCNSIMDYSNR